MFYAPEGQRVIQTWSHFNRNHSSFLGKGRISVEFFQNYEIPFPGGSVLALSLFLIPFNTNIWILWGKSTQGQCRHACLPKINEVLSSKMDTEEVRWEEHGRNPKKAISKDNPLTQASPADGKVFHVYFIFFKGCLQIGGFSPWKSAWGRRRWTCKRWFSPSSG